MRSRMSMSPTSEATAFHEATKTHEDTKNRCTQRFRALRAFVMNRGSRSCRAGGPFLDPLLVPLALENVPHEDAGGHHVVRIDRAGLDQLLDFRDGHVGPGGHHRIEIPGGAPGDKSAG